MRTQYLCALQCTVYTIICRQANYPDDDSASLLFLCFDHVSLVRSSRWSLAGVSCCLHQTGGWTSAYTVATLSGHNYLQLTPIEFQDGGSNPVLLSQWIQKPTAITIRPRGTIYRISRSRRHIESNRFQCSNRTQCC